MAILLFVFCVSNPFYEEEKPWIFYLQGRDAALVFALWLRVVARENEQIDPRGAAFLQQMGAGGERRACRQDVVDEEDVPAADCDGLRKGKCAAKRRFALVRGEPVERRGGFRAGKGAEDGDPLRCEVGMKDRLRLVEAALAFARSVERNGNGEVGTQKRQAGGDKERVKGGEEGALPPVLERADDRLKPLVVRRDCPCFVHDGGECGRQREAVRPQDHLAAGHAERAARFYVGAAERAARREQEVEEE